MTRLRAALLIGAALMTTSCATGYGARGITGGYTDEKIDETHYHVKFDGNGHASEERVWSFWIYRCAELTRAKGFTHFTIQRPGEKVGRADTAPGMRRAAYTVGADGRAVPTQVGYTYVPIFIPGGTTTSWHSDAVIAMFNDPLPDDLWVLRAESVMATLANYVKSNGEKATAVDRQEVFRRAATMKPSERGYSFGGLL